MNKNIYITTSIPYVNAHPHVGHAQEFVIADTIARLYCLCDHSVRLQTGTDENAFKNIVAAKKLNIDPKVFVEQQFSKFKELTDLLTIKYDNFIRTTEEIHKKGVELFWRSLNPDDLYKKSYSGFYCQGCEDFYLKKDLINGLCPDHKVAPQLIEEENFFFRLSKYQDQLHQLIAEDKIRIIPRHRKNEILNFIESGLQDISVTRDSSRSEDWGICVPENPQQVIYVWIDALVNYLSGQGYGSTENWQQTWNSETLKIHVIGKNVWKFHAVYWPALLLSANLPLPDEIIIHAFLTVNGEKISKSLGNSIDPIKVINQFGTDSFRHFILNSTSIYQDADFSLERFHQVYNTELANSLGNLVSRLSALKEKSNFAFSLQEAKDSTIQQVKIHLSDYNLQGLIQNLWKEVNKINAEINDKRPWEFLKCKKADELHLLLQDWFSRIQSFNTILKCYLPNTAVLIEKNLIQNLGERKILFPRL